MTETVFLCRCEYHWNISPQPRSLLSDQTQWAQIPFLKIRPKFRPKVTDPDPKNGFIRQENAAPPLSGYPEAFGGQTPPDPLRLLPCLAGSVLRRPVLRAVLLRSSFRSLSWWPPPWHRSRRRRRKTSTATEVLAPKVWITVREVPTLVRGVRTLVRGVCSILNSRRKLPDHILEGKFRCSWNLLKFVQNVINSSCNDNVIIIIISIDRCNKSVVFLSKLSENEGR
jgi:hypothetical protein